MAGVAMMAAAGVSAVSGIQQGKYAEKVGKYNQQAAYNEAESMEIQAGQEVAAGTHNAARIAKRAKEIMAQQRANAAAGGGSTQDASVQAIQSETVRNASLDQLLVMAGAEERAQQIRHGADVKRSEGDFALSQGKMKKQASYLDAGTTLLKAGVTWQEKFG